MMYADPEIVSRVLGHRRNRGPPNRLTPRERDVLAAMAEGKSNLSIAEALVVSEAAVEKQVTGTLHKLGIGPSTAEHHRGLAV